MGILGAIASKTRTVAQPGRALVWEDAINAYAFNVATK